MMYLEESGGTVGINFLNLEEMKMAESDKAVGNTSGKIKVYMLRLLQNSNKGCAYNDNKADK